MTLPIKWTLLHSASLQSELKGAAAGQHTYTHTYTNTLTHTQTPSYYVTLICQRAASASTGVSSTLLILTLSLCSWNPFTPLITLLYFSSLSSTPCLPDPLFPINSALCSHICLMNWWTDTLSFIMLYKEKHMYDCMLWRKSDSSTVIYSHLYRICDCGCSSERLCRWNSVYVKHISWASLWDEPKKREVAASVCAIND